VKRTRLAILGRFEEVAKEIVADFTAYFGENRLV
jgi:hypothetical protein